MSVRRSHPDDLWLEVGFVTKPHGLKSWLEFRSHSGGLDALAPGRVLRFELVSGASQDAALLAFRPFKKGALLQVEGLDERSAADRLRGARVLARRADLDPLDDDEIYLADLMGLEAVLPDGQVAGRVTDVVDTGPVPSLVIEGDLSGAVPFHEDWVGDPDFGTGRLPIHRRPVA